MLHDAAHALCGFPLLLAPAEEHELLGRAEGLRKPAVRHVHVEHQALEGAIAEAIQRVRRDLLAGVQLERVECG